MPNPLTLEIPKETSWTEEEKILLALQYKRK